MTEDGSTGTVICRLPTTCSTQEWGRFSHPVEIISAQVVEDVRPAFSELSAKVADGYHAAGYIRYEAATAFDDANVTLPHDASRPLLWFGVYEGEPKPLYLDFLSLSPSPDEDGARAALPGGPRTETTCTEYLRSARRVLEYIKAGDIYQANLTFRKFLAASSGERQPDMNLFLSLMRSHPVPYGAYIDTGDERIISISPELFLKRIGDVITTIPMKGTAARKADPRDDAEAALELSNDEKNRAENLMIVDMARNDLGRVCAPGTIRVKNLFKIESYATVHQMTSEITGRLNGDADLFKIFQATFPAASITGAPKIRAMEIIRELEKSPRGVYTGCVGCVAPGGDFLFNVAIRTITASNGAITLGVGGGIVADSVPKDEWREALLKSEFATGGAKKDFRLLETMLWRREIGNPNKNAAPGTLFLEEHLARMRRSAEFFGFAYDDAAARAAIAEAVQGLPDSANLARIRLTMSRDGAADVQAVPLNSDGWGKTALKVAVSVDAVDSEDIFLRHKTTNRGFYDARFKKALDDGFDETIFVNERGEVTEGAISNVFAKFAGEWRTPPSSCGLLPGVHRAKLIRELNAEERPFSLKELLDADEILLCNSVRGAAPAKIAENPFGADSPKRGGRLRPGAIYE